LWRVNGLIKHLPLTRPTNIDENGPKWTKTASFFVNFRPIVSSSVYEAAAQSINASFLEWKSRTSGKIRIISENLRVSASSAFSFCDIIAGEIAIRQLPRLTPYFLLPTPPMLPFDTPPALTVSQLAEHTKNLRQDARASLLVAEGGEEDPLANGRVTMLGSCRLLDAGAERESAESAKRAYLEAHPNAEYYIDYKDFGFWRLDVEAVRYIGGYGRMSWVSQVDWADGTPDQVAPHARAIIDHMNADHADALLAYCRAVSKAKNATAATMTGVDRYGFEMSATTDVGPRPIRLAFSQPISSPEEARREMVALVKQAQAELG
jgi:putative heme iron utilization protein